MRGGDLLDAHAVGDLVLAPAARRPGRDLQVESGHLLLVELAVQLWAVQRWLGRVLAPAVGLGSRLEPGVDSLRSGRGTPAWRKTAAPDEAECCGWCLSFLWGGWG